MVEWGRVWKVKPRKVMGLWDKGSLIRKAKAMYRQTKTRNLFSPLHWLAGLYHSQESRALSHIMLTWEDKLHHSKCPPSPSSPSSICWAWHHGLAYPCGYLGSAVLIVSLDIFMCTPSLLWWDGVRSRRGLNSVSTAHQWLKHPWVIDTVPSTNPTHGSIPDTVKKTNSIPAQTITHMCGAVLLEENYFSGALIAYSDGQCINRV